METYQVILIAAVAGLAASVFFLGLALFLRRGGGADELRGEVALRMDGVSEQLTQLNARLGEVTSQVVSQGSSTAGLFGDVSRSLGELTRTSDRVVELGRDISELRDILAPPKARGGFGELMLADLLAQCLPSRNYALQYGFSTGSRVDAVIKLSGGLVPVDAKFPLDNFKKLATSDGAEAKSARRRFTADLKRHIDAIADSYILPDEGTLNFALMYIPAENVYYEAVLKDDGGSGTVVDHALTRRVIPVSPNSFFAYLQTVLMGLRGMEVSERARAIMGELERLRGDFEAFSSELDTLGRHLGNAGSKYEDARRRATLLGARITALSSVTGGAEGPGGEAGTDEKVSD